MPCDSSFPRRLRANVLALAIATFGLFAGAESAFAQEPATAPAEMPAAAPGATGDTPATPELSASAEPPADTRGLDEEIQNLKKDVVDLNKDLFVLEEELLFPANTQVAVWGAVLILISVGAYLLSRKARRDWVGLLVAIVPFTIALYFFFQNVNRLLPPGL